jgi:DNA-binding NarL/FixJ family response regulator
MSPQSRLDEREVEVFTLMAQGLTNVEIADKLSLSPKTISNISQTVKEKLGVHRAADITLMAVRYGLIEP